MKKATISPDNVKRIHEISAAMVRLSTELSLLTGASAKSNLEANPEALRDIVAHVFGTIVTSEVDYKKRVSPKQSEVRFAYSYLLKKFTRLNNRNISLLQGGVEHSVIYYRLDRANDLIQTDPEFRDKIIQCIERARLLI